MMRRPSLLTLFATLIVLSVVLSGIFAAWLAPYNPFQPDMAHRMELPNALHWLGTDALGRDMLSRLLFGSRYTILLALLSTAVALLLGTLAGLLAGYYGGIVDASLTAAANIFQGIPGACFMVAVAGFWGPGLDFRGRSARLGLQRCADSLAAYRAEPLQQFARARGAAFGARHPGDCGTELPWPRRAAACSRLERDGQRCYALLSQCAASRLASRRVHSALGRIHQHLGERAAQSTGCALG